MLKGGRISFTKDHICREEFICEITLIDSTEHISNQTTTRASAAPTLSAKEIELEMIAIAQQENIHFVFQKYWTEYRKRPNMVSLVTILKCL